jgi:uncharacterized membrane protein
MSSGPGGLLVLAFGKDRLAALLENAAAILGAALIVEPGS